MSPVPLQEEVQAEPLWLENRHGRRMFALLCRASTRDADRLAVLPPAYSRTVRHYAVRSRFLVRNGYATLRFDLTNHVGLSEGEIADFTISSTAEDIEDVLRVCAERFPERTLHVVASSLAARGAIRALAADPELQRRTGGLVLTLPVVDLEHTTTQAIGKNPFEAWRTHDVTDPARRGDAAGHELSYAVVRDALENGFADAEGTRKELSELACPVTAIAAKWDDWVDFATVADVMGGDQAGPRDTVVLEADSHALSRRPELMRLLMEHVVRALSGPRAAPAEVKHLEREEIVETMVVEKEWSEAQYRSPELDRSR